MAIGTILGLASLAASLIQAGAARAKQKKAERYQDRVNSNEQYNQRESKRDAKRDALARAIGAKTPYMDKYPMEGPRLPDTSGEDMAGGVAQGVGMLANYGMANEDKIGDWWDNRQNEKAMNQHLKTQFVDAPDTTPRYQRYGKYSDYGASA